MQYDPMEKDFHIGKNGMLSLLELTTARYFNVNKASYHNELGNNHPLIPIDKETANKWYDDYVQTVRKVLLVKLAKFTYTVEDKKSNEFIAFMNKYKNILNLLERVEKSTHIDKFMGNIYQGTSFPLVIFTVKKTECNAIVSCAGIYVFTSIEFLKKHFHVFTNVNENDLLYLFEFSSYVSSIVFLTLMICAAESEYCKNFTVNNLLSYHDLHSIVNLFDTSVKVGYKEAPYLLSEYYQRYERMFSPAGTPKHLITMHEKKLALINNVLASYKEVNIIQLKAEFSYKLNIKWDLVGKGINYVADNKFKHTINYIMQSHDIIANMQTYINQPYYIKLNQMLLGNKMDDSVDNVPFVNLSSKNNSHTVDLTMTQSNKKAKPDAPASKPT